MDKSKLLSYKEANSVSISFPYIFIYRKGKQAVFYFGSDHSNDIEDKQFPMLKEFWGQFLLETEVSKRVAFEEGGRRPYLENEKDSIHNYGEMGYLVHLATKAKVDIFSPEPPEAWRFNELAKHFSKDEIAYHDFARVVHQWNRIPNKPPFREYIATFLEGDKANSGWTEFDFSLEHMLKISSNLFHKDFDENDDDFFGNIVDPTQSISVINEISRFEGENLRDGYILDQFEKYWNDGFSIFAVYGGTHAVRQEPVIRTLL